MKLGGRFSLLPSHLLRGATFLTLSRKLMLLWLVLPLLHASGAQLTLAWNDNSSDESGFKIERATGTGTFSQIATVSANTTTYLDTSLAAGTSYSYRVRAYNTAGNSAYSNAVSHTTASAGVTNTAPTISAIADQTIDANTATSALAFTIGDAETSAGSLSLSASSSNTTLVPNSNVLFGGSGASRTVKVTPTADKGGTATITITVSDGLLSASRSFTVIVNSITSTPGTNTAPAMTALSDLTINANGTATQSFKVSDVESGSGSLTLSGSSSNTTLVPVNGISFGSKGANRTISVSPAAGRSGTATITVTVSDGVLTSDRSFKLTINATSSNTSPTISDIDDLALAPGVSSVPVPFTVSDAETAAGSLVLTAGSSNTSLVPASGIVLGGSGDNRTVTVKPASGQTGSAVITILVSDGSLQGSTTFGVTVGTAKATNTAPSISGIGNQAIVQNTSTSTLGFKVTDAETAASNLTLTTFSSNSSLIPLSGINLGGSGGERTISVTPARNQSGTSLITILVKDAGGLATSTNFEVSVLSTSNGTPQISQQPVSQTAKMGADVIFSVTASGNPSPGYQWRRDGAPIHGATGPTLTINSVNLDSMGAYDVVISNSKGSVTSDSAVLAVNLPKLSGTYFGTFTGGGSWALYVRTDYTASFIATVPSRAITLVLELAVATDGSFKVASSTVTALGSSFAQSASVDGSSAGTKFASSTEVTLKGWIIDGQVSGNLLSLGVDFSGQADSATGPVKSLAGYATATSSNGSLYSIVGSNGETLMVIATSSLVDSATGTTQATGKFTGTTALGAQVVSSTDPTKLTLSASYVGGGGSVSFVGRAEHAPSASRFVNVSVRTKASAQNPLIAGFVVRGSTAKSVVVRGIGPTLSNYGVNGVLSDPTLALYRGKELAVSNDDWGSASTSPQIVDRSTRVGAFPLVNGSRDAVVVTSVQEGAYSAYLTGKGNEAGVSLIELYDADQSGGSRLVNVSTRSFVGVGEDVLVVGFVIAGEGPRQVLIRAVGPTLDGYGVSGTLANPYLRLFKGETLLQQNDDWSGSDTLANAFSKAGAFQMSSTTSKDAALLVTLQPGVYSAMVAGVNGGTGVALLELYEMP